jgi:hypothetical protein
MTERYVCIDQLDQKTFQTSTFASGPIAHVLDWGPSIGFRLGYSGDVVANPGVEYVMMTDAMGQDRSLT